MTFVVPLTMYEACGRCGKTWPLGGMRTQLTVTTHDLAQATVRSTVARFLGQPTRRTARQERRLLEASLLRVRAVMRRGPSGSLAGHPIMKAHHGSARRNLSEDFGIAVAMSFAERRLACREHYFLDAIPNAAQFGFPAGKRPDIGSVTTSGSRVLTEAKGSVAIRQLAPRAGRVEPAKLVRDSYRQLTGNGRAGSSTPMRLFLAVTSPIADGRSVGLEAAEYVTTRRSTRQFRADTNCAGTISLLRSTGASTTWSAAPGLIWMTRASITSSNLRMPTSPSDCTVESPKLPRIDIRSSATICKGYLTACQRRRSIPTTAESRTGLSPERIGLRRSETTRTKTRSSSSRGRSIASRAAVFGPPESFGSRRAWVASAART